MGLCKTLLGGVAIPLHRFGVMRDYGRGAPEKYTEAR